MARSAPGGDEIIEHIGTWRENHAPDRHGLANELFESMTPAPRRA